MVDDINIIKSKDNILNIDIEVDGINSSDEQCFFNIDMNNYVMSIRGKKLDGNTWEVTIPNHSDITKSKYDFKIILIVDGYYFEPHSGNLNIVKNATAKVDSITTITDEPKPIHKALKLKKVSKIIEKPIEKVDEIIKDEVIHKDTSKADDMVANILKDSNKSKTVKKPSLRELNAQFMESTNTSPMVQRTNAIIKEKERRVKGLDLEKQQQIMDILQDS